MSHCNELLCQQVTLSGYAEWPKVADAMIEASQTLLEMAKDLVLAQIQAKALSPDDMHQMLQLTHTCLLALKAQEESEGIIAVTASETPAKPVNWRKSITKHTVTCLECGASFK